MQSYEKPKLTINRYLADKLLKIGFVDEIPMFFGIIPVNVNYRPVAYGMNAI